MKNLFNKLIIGVFVSMCFVPLNAQSDAHDLNELLLQAIREDLARPTVHARNLWHTSAAMYDAWAIINGAEPYLLGNVVDGYDNSGFIGFTPEGDPEEEMLEAINFAAYRLIRWRFRNSTLSFLTNIRLDNYMQSRGYDITNISTNYFTGDGAALGNYIYQQYQQFGLQDGSNEAFNYNNVYYSPSNEPLVMDDLGNTTLTKPNRWQPLSLSVNIDQSGNVIPGSVLSFLSPEWGNVTPFSLRDPVALPGSGGDYNIFINPGPPAILDTIGNTGTSDDYKWGFGLVAMWGSHLDPSDGVMWDISPRGIGNLPEDMLPENYSDYPDFYNLLDGGDPSLGRDINPYTGQPYESQMVPRGDYTRVLAEFWADGPDSETPPGHWFTILNEVNKHPALEKRFNGQGEVLSDLEWDIKCYFMLGAAMHDVAINTWSLKGYYDYIRPVSAIRYMAEKGQSSDENLPNYHIAGFPLQPGYVELVEEGDPLAGENNEFVNEVKLYTWLGPDYIDDPETDEAGVGWILAKNWWPYQRPTFVTPPFAGYVSGHSTYSRAAAEVLTYITGDEYFPGGMGVFPIQRNEFLVFEEGPSVDFELQWATYRDASDQTSLSRIWGGIHPPCDDIPGRIMGIEIADMVIDLSLEYFFDDVDGDGFYSHVDCDDNNPMINPGLAEICDGLDNDCNGDVDDGLQFNTYYIDADGDGFGSAVESIESCMSDPDAGYADNTLDCNDSDPDINPDSPEVCDNIDNDCDGVVNDGLEVYTYYMDSDGDGFGDADMPADTCITNPPAGFVTSADDCDDQNPDINPDAEEICDGLDNNCDGAVNEGLQRYSYYLDSDADGFGDLNMELDTCVTIPPQGFVENADDCDDNNPLIFPGGIEIADNGIDEDCTGFDLYLATKIFSNPVQNQLEIRLDQAGDVDVFVYDSVGRLVAKANSTFADNFINLDLDHLHSGIYWLRLAVGEEIILEDKIVKL